jgi:hypothetical protein
MAPCMSFNWLANKIYWPCKSQINSGRGQSQSQLLLLYGNRQLCLFRCFKGGEEKQVQFIVKKGDWRNQIHISYQNKLLMDQQDVKSLKGRIKIKATQKELYFYFSLAYIYSTSGFHCDNSIDVYLVLWTNSHSIISPLPSSPHLLNSVWCLHIYM